MVPQAILASVSPMAVFGDASKILQLLAESRFVIIGEIRVTVFIRVSVLIRGCKLCCSAV